EDLSRSEVLEARSWIVLMRSKDSYLRSKGGLATVSSAAERVRPAASRKSNRQPRRTMPFSRIRPGKGLVPDGNALEGRSARKINGDRSHFRRRRGQFQPACF